MWLLGWAFGKSGGGSYYGYGGEDKKNVDPDDERRALARESNSILSFVLRFLSMLKPGYFLLGSRRHGIIQNGGLSVAARKAYNTHLGGSHSADGSRAGAEHHHHVHDPQVRHRSHTTHTQYALSRSTSQHSPSAPVGPPPACGHLPLLLFVGLLIYLFIRL